MEFKLIRPFGPSIGEFKLDSSVIDQVNDYVENNLLKDKKKEKI